jgi:amino acid transporter
VVTAAARPPQAISVVPASGLPEPLGYRVKNRFLGPPLTTEQLRTERLGRPTALAVLSSDVISSSAYATEQALIPLVKIVGIAAFSLIVPVSIAVIVVLAFVTLSYLEVVKVYTKAGGAYVVARENFGLTVAQVAAMALLIDYTLTVAVSVAAGVAALTSVFPVLVPGTTWIAVALVMLIAFANLRGVREAGRVFAIPTYLFIANMGLLLMVGAVRAVDGSIGPHAIHQPGAVPIGVPGSGWLYGASLFWILRSFASGGSALTGTEAISNGVSVFRRPESRNARITMIWMSLILGSLVLGVSALAAVVHPVPFESGTPTVVSQIAKYVYGSTWIGHGLYVLLQASTMLILVLAANTSFTGFPYLASFAAEDSYLPHALTKRGHRLVFSTGIIVLTVVSVLLLVITRAKVDNLIPLYAIGVFTGFTMAGAGMVRYHLRQREPQWRRRAVINGIAAVLSLIVDVVIVVTKFTEGAWTIVIILPLGVFALLRLHRQYAQESTQLEVDAARACLDPILRRHVVIVLVNELDLATARAVQYARTLSPDDLRAVHFDIDDRVALKLEDDWGRLGLSRLPLDIVECPDRRLVRATLQMVAEVVADGETECTVLLPRREFKTVWERLLHDRTADKIAVAAGQVPHVSATIIPFNLTSPPARRARRYHELVGAGKGADHNRGPEPARGDMSAGRAGGTVPIAEVQWRQRVRVAGRVRSVRVQPRAGTSNLECVIVDPTGAMLLVFQGRPRIPGIVPGARIVAEGMVGAWARRLAMLNPDYELLADLEGQVPEPSG